MSKLLNNSPLILVGMHRSGTSMLSQYIDELGYFTGRDKQQDNESLFFIKINNWILHQHNASWDNPSNYRFSNEFLRESIIRNVEKYLNSISLIRFLGFKRYVSQRFFGNSQRLLWGWKDPRNSITLDLWSRIFSNPRVIHIYRNPLDVATSLAAREKHHKDNFGLSFVGRIKERFLLGMPGYQFSPRVEHLAEGYKLWCEYTENVFLIENQLQLPILHIKYEDFLMNPMKVMKEIALFLELTPSDEILDRFLNRVKRDNAFKFLKDKEQSAFYNSVKNDPLMIKLNYDKLTE